MGFHKRFINKENTKRALDNKTLNKLYKADALVFDDKFSSKVYELYNKGLTEDKILKKLNKKNPIKQLWEFLLFVEQKRMEAQEKSMIGKI